MSERRGGVAEKICARREGHLPWLTWWVLACAYATLSGWTLSLAGNLNATGYAVALGVGIAAVFFGMRCGFGAALWRGLRVSWPLHVGKLRWRFRHLLPLVFLVYAVGVFLGGLLYAPNNYDALSYRLPRVLNWLAEHRWHWLAANDVRPNVSATGFEWLMAPLLAVTGSDRCLFLINGTFYLVMPGLFFGVATRLGVRRRVAWHWMWIMPAGICFVLQAGGIGNDLFGAVYFLAALFFTLRARETGRVSDLWLGMLAAALLSGAKASNLPLLLPWALASLPSLKLLRTKAIASTAVLLLALGISFLPNALLHVRFTGDWTGDPQNTQHMKLAHPGYGLLGNGIEIAGENAAPPVVPFVDSINRSFNKWKEAPFFQEVVRYYPRFDVNWNELSQEESAGVELGLSALLVITLVAALGKGCSPGFPWGGEVPRSGLLVCLSGWVALGVYMAKMGSEAAPRLITPYYPILFITVLLVPGNAALVRARWWRTAALAAVLFALPPLVLSPSRPLWPAQTVCGWLQQKFPGNRLCERVATVYAAYQTRFDALAPLRGYFPPHAREIGFIGDDDLETSLWRPYGSRRVVNLTPENLQQTLGGRVSIVVLTAEALRENFGCSLDPWLAQNHLRILGKRALLTRIKRGLQEWYVVEVSG